MTDWMWETTRARPVRQAWRVSDRVCEDSGSAEQDRVPTCSGSALTELSAHLANANRRLCELSGPRVPLILAVLVVVLVVVCAVLLLVSGVVAFRLTVERPDRLRRRLVGGVFPGPLGHGIVDEFGRARARFLLRFVGGGGCGGSVQVRVEMRVNEARAREWGGVRGIGGGGCGRRG